MLRSGAFAFGFLRLRVLLGWLDEGKELRSAISFAIKVMYLTPKTISKDRTNKKAVDKKPAKKEESIFIIDFLFSNFSTRKTTNNNNIC